MTMAKLSGNTLMMAVQAVHAEMQRVRGDVSITDLEPDDQELLLAYSRAAEELKAAYADVCKTSPGLPPYADLVAGGG